VAGLGVVYDLLAIWNNPVYGFVERWSAYFAS
jgi:hypothetical protein